MQLSGGSWTGWDIVGQWGGTGVGTVGWDRDREVGTRVGTVAWEAPTMAAAVPGCVSRPVQQPRWALLSSVLQGMSGRLLLREI